MALPDGHGAAIVEAGDYPDAFADGVNDRSANEDCVVGRAVHVFDLEIGLEAVNLPSKRVAADLDVHKLEGVGSVV